MRNSSKMRISSAEADSASGWNCVPKANQSSEVLSIASTTPSGHTGFDTRLRLEKIPILVAHEFGHVLGLGHCLECDAAMNYSWASRGRVIVTEEDVRAFLALVAQPNGVRVDGRRMEILDLDADPVPRD